LQHNKNGNKKVKGEWIKNGFESEFT
jgi:hypothetical protein